MVASNTKRQHKNCDICSGFVFCIISNSKQCEKRDDTVKFLVNRTLCLMIFHMINFWWKIYHSDNR